jgi:hypothetical protein
MSLKKIMLLAFLTVALGQVAHANTTGTLTLSDCGGGVSGCPAATYSFNIGTTSATLTIQINGSVPANANQIEGVDLGFTTQTLQGLTGTTSMSGTWAFSQASLTNNGCGTQSQDPAACAMISSGTPTTIVTGGTYSWTWNWTNALSATDIASVGNIHIGANYDPANGLIVSQTGATSVPEPNSLVLLGVALIGFAGVIRRNLTL